MLEAVGGSIKREYQGVSNLKGEMEKIGAGTLIKQRIRDKYRRKEE